MILPSIGYRFWFYPGDYTPPTIATVDQEEIRPVEPTYQVFDEQPATSIGHVVIDLSHENNLSSVHKTCDAWKIQIQRDATAKIHSA